MSQAFVTRRMLRWARERHNVSQADVAKRLGTSPDKVHSWETEGSDAYPTLRQAQDIAGMLHVPVGYLFLSDPPSLTVTLPDLRTVAGAPVHDPSPEFLDHLYDILRKQSWYREYQEMREAQPVEFIGRFTTSNFPEEIAQDMVAVLRIDDEMRRRVASWERFLTQFVRRAEEAGVLVFRSGVVEGNTHRPLSVEEFRGFAISDDLAPVVFVNAKDAKAAQVFTLAHELAHLWVGESGISNPNYSARLGNQVNGIDRLCDRVAAEVLVPKADFLMRWQYDRSIASNLQALASHYRVSRFVVLRRAYEAETITDTEFQQYFEELMADTHESTGEGGNFYNLLLSRNSPTLTFTLISMAIEGRIPRREAAQLLNVRVGTIESIRRELFTAGTTDA